MNGSSRQTCFLVFLALLGFLAGCTDEPAAPTKAGTVGGGDLAAGSGAVVRNIGGLTESDGGVIHATAELSARVHFPGLGGFLAWPAPTTVRIGFEGTDPGAANGLPSQYRYLFIPAVWQGTVISNDYLYNLHGQNLIADTNPGWSTWTDFPADEAARILTFGGLAADTYHLLALQVRDAKGHVSVGAKYQVNVMNLVARSYVYSPEVLTDGAALGVSRALAEEYAVSPGRALSFSWTASAQNYNGVIVSSRYGWDLADVDDPADPGWSVEPGLTPAHFASPTRSFAAGTHSLWIRVVDDAGQVQVLVRRFIVTSPGELTARVRFPLLSGFSAWPVPPTVHIGFEGTDSGAANGLPAQYRYLFIPAVWQGTIISNAYLYNLYRQNLITDTNPAWSAWTTYPVDETARVLTFSGLAEGTHHLLALQVRDGEGHVSEGANYQVEVMNLAVRRSVYRPELYTDGAALGWSGLPFVGYSVSPGQALSFSWTASAPHYNGVIVSSRYGWDLADVDDPDDPGWSIDPGLTPVHFASPTRSFVSGRHSLWIRVVDECGQSFAAERQFTVIQ